MNTTEKLIAGLFKSFARGLLTAVMLSIAFVAMLAAPPRAQAQLAQYTFPLSSAFVSSASTTNLTNSASVGVKQGYLLSFLASFNGTSATASNGYINLKFNVSHNNGSNWTTTLPLATGILLMDTNRTVTHWFSFGATNGSVLQGVTDIRCDQIICAATNAVSNIVLRVRPFPLKYYGLIN